MTHATIGRWGRSLAVRVPNEIADAISLHEGDRVDIAVDAGNITIRPAPPRYRLGDLFAGKSPDQWRVLYAGAYDWGPDRGREIIEE